MEKRMDYESSVSHGRLNVLVDAWVTIYRVGVDERHSPESSGPINTRSESTVKGMDQQPTVVVPDLSRGFGIGVPEIGWNSQLGRYSSFAIPVRLCLRHERRPQDIEWVWLPGGSDVGREAQSTLA